MLQDPSESVFWAGFKGRFIPPEKVFGALGYIYIYQSHGITMRNGYHGNVKLLPFLK